MCIVPGTSTRFAPFVQAKGPNMGVADPYKIESGRFRAAKYRAP